MCYTTPALQTVSLSDISPVGINIYNITEVSVWKIIFFWKLIVKNNVRYKTFLVSMVAAPYSKYYHSIDNKSYYLIFGKDCPKIKRHIPGILILWKNVPNNLHLSWIHCLTDHVTELTFLYDFFFILKFSWLLGRVQGRSNSSALY